MGYYFWDANNEARKDISHISEKIKSIPEYNKLNDDLRKYSDDSISALKKSINGDMDALRKELSEELIRMLNMRARDNERVLKYVASSIEKRDEELEKIKSKLKITDNESGETTDDESMKIHFMEPNDSNDLYKEEFVIPLVNRFIECETQKDNSMIELIYSDPTYVIISEKEEIPQSKAEIKTDCIKNWKRWPERKFKLIFCICDDKLKNHGGILIVCPTFRFTFKSGDKQSKGYSRQTWIIATTGENKGKIRAYKEIVDLIK